MADLKLIALDHEDLQVISANLQDAVVKVEDIAYLPKENRFVALLNRFDWHNAEAKREDEPHVRRRAAFRLERVMAAQLQGIDLADKTRVLNLLAISFEEAAAGEPSGHVTLLFAGAGAIRLRVECIEAELRDLGGAWAAKSRPDHASDDDKSSTQDA